MHDVGIFNPKKKSAITMMPEIKNKIATCRQTLKGSFISRMAIDVLCDWLKLSMSENSTDMFLESIWFVNLNIIN